MSLLLLFNNQVAPDPAQVMPTVQVLLETTADVMVDVSADYEMLTTTRGRNRELDRFQAGTAQVQLLDTSRKYDPSNAAGPYYPNLKPMRALQLTGTWNGTTYPLFTGTVDSFESQYDGPPNGNAVTTIYATDGFKALEAAGLASSAYAVEVIKDSVSRWWRLEEPAGSTKLLATTGGVDLTVSGTPTFGQDSLVARDSGSALLVNATTDGGISGVTPSATVTAVTAELLFKGRGSNPTGLTMAAEVNELVTVGWVLECATGIGTFGFRFTVTTSAGSVQLNQGQVYADTNTAVHHVVGTWDGTFANLYVDGALVAGPTAIAGTMFSSGVSTYTLIAGATTAQPGPLVNTGAQGTYDEVAVYYSALSAARVAAHYATVATPWNGDTPGARLDRVLDAAGWPGSLRQLDTGTVTLQSAELDMSALEHAQKTAESDFGVLFIKAGGSVRFIGRAGLFNLAELATFGDGGGGELGYVSLRPELTDQLIRNDVTVSRLEGVAQNVKDTTSISTYLRHSYTADGLYHNSDAVSRAAAEFLISEFKDPLRRISGMVVAPRGDPSNLFPKVLGLELEDQITVKDRPPGGGSANSQDTSIEGITHTVTPMWWETSWNLAPSFGSQGTPVAVGTWDVTLWDQSRWGF